MEGQVRRSSGREGSASIELGTPCGEGLEHWGRDAGGRRRSYSRTLSVEARRLSESKPEGSCPDRGRCAGADRDRDAIGEGGETRYGAVVGKRCQRARFGRIGVGPCHQVAWSLGSDGDKVEHHRADSSDRGHTTACGVATLGGKFDASDGGAGLWQGGPICSA